jgi:hypothetical protein
MSSIMHIHRTEQNYIVVGYQGVKTECDNSVSTFLLVFPLFSAIRPIGPSERASAADKAIAAHLAAVGNASLALSQSAASDAADSSDTSSEHASSASLSSSASSSSQPTPAALWADMQRLLAALSDSQQRHAGT